MTDTDTLPEVEGRTDTYYLNGAIRTDLKDGVFLNMPEEVYFSLSFNGVKRRGSSDFKELSTDEPEDFFWGSEMNPDVEPSEVDEDMLTGKAVHCGTLEGITAFESKFVKSPYAAYTSKEAREWRAQQIAKGMTPLKEKGWRNALLMSNLIINHPTIGVFLKAGISEVTVLFHYDGIPMRARFDKLTEQYIVDLKTRGRHTDSKRVPPGVPKDIWTCIQVIRNMRYDLQQALYNIARANMKAMVESGMVYDASPRQLAFLKAVVANENWGWIWCFYRKISHSARNPAAPIITPLIVEKGGFTDTRGFDRLAKGIENYKRLMTQFGTAVGWARISDAVPVDDQWFDLAYGGDEEARPVREEGEEDGNDE